MHCHQLLSHHITHSLNPPIHQSTSTNQHRSIHPSINRGFYYWKRPWFNVLSLWVISHICLHPAQWLFSMAVVVAAWMLRRAAIQVGLGLGLIVPVSRGGLDLGAGAV